MQALLAAALFGSLLGLLCPTNSLSSPSPSAPGGNSAPTEHVVPVESERPVPVAQIATLEYDQIMFLAQPPGCDAYLHGSADGHTWWGGCNTLVAPRWASRVSIANRYNKAPALSANALVLSGPDGPHAGRRSCSVMTAKQ